jgi:hypothetical protein
MRFLFKDLMVTVSDAASPHCTNGCSIISCALPTVECGPITCGITSVIHAEEFDVMKLDLDQALEIVRATAAMESETRLGPETVDEANQLEKTLTDALAVVRKSKAELERP